MKAGWRAVDGPRDSLGLLCEIAAPRLLPPFVQAHLQLDSTQIVSFLLRWTPNLTLIFAARHFRSPFSHLRLNELVSLRFLVPPLLRRLAFASVPPIVEVQTFRPRETFPADIAASPVLLRFRLAARLESPSPAGLTSPYHEEGLLSVVRHGAFVSLCSTLDAPPSITLRTPSASLR